jgi:hypothetical protein
MDAESLRQLRDRGRFFYERFPGAAAIEEWKRMREKAEQDHAARTHGDGVPQGEEDVSRRSADPQATSRRDT